MQLKFLRSLTLLFLGILPGAMAQDVPTPKQHFGFNIGDDYKLANYTQTEAYFKKLSASPRTRYVDIGLTEEGRHQFMLIVSSPENIKNLDKYKDISRKLSHAEGLSETDARRLSQEGKAIVWIDGGLHASEVLGAHQLIETAFQLVTRTDAETMRLLDGAIILMVHANPDGQELVSNWYMRNDIDTTRRSTNTPRLWQKYIGHDNNRDFYMMNMSESRNIARQQYFEWCPQIVYNHHQTAPAGAVVAGPPYRDPFNYVYDPILVTSLDAIGAAMNTRANVEGKQGYTSRSGSTFSTWWNGGLRTTTYFHNMLGLLTEMIGSPTPTDIPLVPDRLIPSSATPNPVAPQRWHFRQSIDYSVSLNYAVLEYAVRNHDELLYNIYKMGRNSIDKGSTDTWTLSPKKSEAIRKAAASASTSGATAQSGLGTGGGGGAGGGQGGRNGLLPKYYDAVLKNPEFRDPRAYVIPSDQDDFPTAVKFVNTLIRAGIYIHKATAPVTIGGKQYPAGSYVIKTDQAFRPHILDMFEPQDHPNDFKFEGGPPIPPYDAAGWTLAYQMGVKFDRILDGFTASLTRLPYYSLEAMPAAKLPATAKAGYLLSPKVNNAFIVANDVLAAGGEVYRVTAAAPGAEAGSFYIPSSVLSKNALAKSALENGVATVAATKKPSALMKINPARIALYDNYGGSMTSGWTRWILEQYHFPFKLIYPKQIDEGDLISKYDVILFIDGGIPSLRSRGGFGGGGGGSGGGGTVPQEFQYMTGSVTAEKSIPELKKFMEAGGSVVTVGSGTNLAYHLGLPVKDALTETSADGQERPLPGEKYYIPGSILQATFSNDDPSEWGMPVLVDVNFDNSPVFRLQPGAEAKGVKPLARYASSTTLRSGWAWGQAYLKDGIAAFEAPVGQGKLYAFGPGITFRGQSHGTFKLLFNNLYSIKK